MMNAIAELRKALGLSQAELSRRSGIKQQTICMLETGKRKTPRLDTAAKLAAALNCTVDELLKDGEPQPEEMRPRLNEGTRSFEDNPPHHTLNR